MKRARKVCSAIGCPNLALPGRRFCKAHDQEYGREMRGRRDPGTTLYGTLWRRESKAFLRDHPYCADGCGGLATVVDHIRPHRGDPVLFWDKDNWQALTKRHHDAKTAREDGGGGNKAGDRSAPTLANRLARTGKAQR